MSLAANPAAEGIRWDLSALFASLEDPKIEETWRASHARADRFASLYRGKVAAGTLSAAELEAALREYEALITEASKPAIYASLIFAADVSDPRNGAFYQEQSEKGSELRVKLMFFDLELKDAPDAWAETVLADPVMANYVHHVRVARAMKPHALSETEEVLMEEVANIGSRAWVRLHEETTANFKFSYTAPDGTTQELSQEEVLDKLRDPSRAVRQAAADSFTAGLQAMERTIVFTYNTLLADKKLEDRLRNHPYPEHSRHLANELDKETVDLVMRLCREKGELVARYYRVKRQILGLDRLTHIDRYAPLFDTKERVDWPTGKQMVLDAFSAFHPTLGDTAKLFFDGNWIDAEPRQGKGGGAFCSYNTPDTHPVLLQSYLGKLEDVMTLAHEMGHGVHGALSRKQTYLNFSGTLPLAELASIFGEMLVFERLVARADTKDKLALYASKVESVFASVYRQAAMFRFEQRCHQHRREEGELAPETFRALWQDELQSMFGDSVEMEEQHGWWWSYVGHFFFAPFYVYAYSFGELLALAIYQKAKSAGPEFRDRYIAVLELGGCETPHELMAHLDVALRSESFWLGGFAVIEDLIAQFENLWTEVRA